MASIALEPIPEGPSVSRSEVCHMMEDAINQLTDRLDALVMQITEKSMIGIMGNLEENHCMAFLCDSLREAIRSMLTSILNDEGVRDAFETAVIQLATSGPMVLATAKVPVNEEKIAALTVRFVASQARKEVREAGQQSVIFIPPPPPFFPTDSSSSEDEWKPQRSKTSCRRR